MAIDDTRVDPYFCKCSLPGPPRPLLSDSAVRWLCGTLVVLALIGGALIGLRYSVLPGLGLCFLVAMVLGLIAFLAARVLEEPGP